MKYICNANINDGTKDENGRNVIFKYGSVYSGSNPEPLLKKGLLITEEEFKKSLKNRPQSMEALVDRIRELEDENDSLKAQLGFPKHPEEKKQEPAEDMGDEYQQLMSKGVKELKSIAEQLGIDMPNKVSKEELVQLIISSSEESEE